MRLTGSALSIVLILLTCNHGRSTTDGEASASPARGVLRDGEELVYEVRWSFIHIGTIRLRTSALPPVSGSPRFGAEAAVDSYDGLPIVDIHARITSVMDTTMRSQGATTMRLSDDGWTGLEYVLDHQASTAVIDRIVKSDPANPPLTRFHRDTLDIRRLHPMQDGLSLLYYARAFARSRTSTSVPVISQGSLGTARFDFGTGSEELTTDVFAGPVQTIAFEGNVDVRGLYGLSGEFRGWVTDDEAAIPVRAEVQVILGSVVIELKECRRPDWSPPR